MTEFHLKRNIPDIIPIHEQLLNMKAVRFCLLFFGIYQIKIKNRREIVGVNLNCYFYELIYL